MTANTRFPVGADAPGGPGKQDNEKSQTDTYFVRICLGFSLIVAGLRGVKDVGDADCHTAFCLRAIPHNPPSALPGKIVL